MDIDARFILERRSLPALVVAAFVAARWSADAAEPDREQTDNIFFAYRYALPLFEIARLRYHKVFDPTNPRRVPINILTHSRTLADHTTRAVTTPNNDTLYSSAELDLTKGPVRIEVPDFAGRYYSIALMDAFTNNFAYIGRRTTGTRPGSFLVVGPQWQGTPPDPDRIIRAPTDWVFLLVRILVEGGADVSAVHRLQDEITLTSLAADPTPPTPIAPIPDDGANFVAVVNEALAANPPPAADAPALARIAKVGVAPGGGALPESLAIAWKTDLSGAEAALRQAVKDTPHRVVSGWSYSTDDTGNFGTDYNGRAVVTLTGLLALTRDEAIYLTSVGDASGRPLDGARRYRLRVPKDLPLDGFWSLSMYEVEPDQRAFFADNSLHRYAIGDRTPGLRRNSDGSLDILIQREAPDPNQTSNWLPMPAAGPFRLTLRAYQPRAALLDGSFHFPGLEPIA